MKVPGRIKGEQVTTRDKEKAAAEQLDNEYREMITRQDAERERKSMERDARRGRAQQ